MEDQPKENENFFNYIFNFDENNKAAFQNMFQYTFIAIPLVIIVLKLINHFTPTEDDSKGTIEITGELIITISSLILSIWFINKIIRFIPTFSKFPYPTPDSPVNFMIPFLILLFTMQTKVGSKVNILVERILNIIDNKPDDKSKKKPGKEGYISSQPISVNSSPPPQMTPPSLTGVQSPSNNTTSIDQLPVSSGGEGGGSPNFNNFFMGPNMDPASMSPEPMAANECLGGGMFGSSF